MQRTVRRRIFHLIRRAIRAAPRTGSITATRLEIVDTRGAPRIVLEVADDVALVRVLTSRGEADVAIHAEGPLDDDPAMAGVTLRAGGSDADAWEIRDTHP